MTNKNFKNKIISGKPTDILNKIKNLNFIQEVASGTLDKNLFEFYLIQDSFYLNFYAKALSNIGNRVLEPEIAIKFFKYAESALQEHKLTYDINYHNLTSATIGYSNFVTTQSLYSPISHSIASIIPCFWVYYEIGLYLKTISTSDNPYADWIEAYTTQKLSIEIDSLFELLSSFEESTIVLQEIFEISTTYEYNFWEDSYNHNLLLEL